MVRTKKSRKNDPSFKKMKAQKPRASRYLRYQLVNSGTGGQETSHYIDLAKDLSAINRRLYRQGKVYQIANISITSRNTTGGLVSFSTAGDTWVTRAAWRRGFAIHDEMTKKVLDLPGSGTRKGRYHDFKVYLSDDHRTSANLPRALDNGNNLAGSGEWIYSKFQSPDGIANGSDEFTAHLLGGHNGGAGSRNSVGLILSYGESRSTVNVDSPNVDSDGSDDPLLNLFDAGTQADEIAFNLENDGDQAPYKLVQGGNLATLGDHYPGGPSNLPKPMVNRLAAIGQQGPGSAPSIMLPGFSAICGLLEVEIQSEIANDEFDIIIEIAPGPYKGVAAYDI
jgi:hypothetical protein